MALTDAEVMYNLALGLIGEYKVVEGATTTKQYLLCSRFYDLARQETLRAHPWNEVNKPIIISQDSDLPIFGYSRKYAKPSDCLRVLTVNDSIGADVSRRAPSSAAWESKGDYIFADAGATPPSWESGKAYYAGQFFTTSSSGSAVTYEVLVSHTSDTTGDDEEAQIAVDVADLDIESKGGDYKIIYVEYIWDDEDVDNYSPQLKYAVAVNLASKIITGLTNDTQGKIALINEYNNLVMPNARSMDGAEGKPRPIFASEWIRSRTEGMGGGWYVV